MELVLNVDNVVKNLMYINQVSVAVIGCMRTQHLDLFGSNSLQTQKSKIGAHHVWPTLLQTQFSIIAIIIRI